MDTISLIESDRHQSRQSSNEMSSVPFERYDEEFDSLISQVSTSLADLRDPESQCASSSSASDLKFASSLLGQCDDLLKQMSVEARGADDAAVKKEQLAKVRSCKKELGKLREEYNSARATLERADLLGPNGSSSRKERGKGGLSNDHRERLLKTTDQIQAQNDTLENAKRVMAETEETALEITEELGRNREKIESAHGRVRDVSGLTNRARRIVQNMSRREVQQKLALYVISFGIVMVFIVILIGLR